MLSDDNGEVAYSNGQFLGSIAILNCNEGYAENHSPATCSTDGWSASPTCTSKCIVVY